LAACTTLLHCIFQVLLEVAQVNGHSAIKNVEHMSFSMTTASADFLAEIRPREFTF
jgi:hypothetical protein